MHAPVLTSFVTDDPGAAREHLVELYGHDQLQVGQAGEGFGYRHERVDLGPVVLDHLRNGQTATYGVPPTGRVFVVQVEAGQVLTSVDGAAHHSRAGDVFLVARPDAALCSTYSGDAVVDVVSIAVPLLHEVDPQHAAARLTGPPVLTLDDLTAEAWRRTSGHLRATLAALTDAGDLPRGRLVLAAHSRLLAATVLQMLTPGRDETSSPGRVDVRPGALDRAVSHIEAHPGADLSPADLAEVARVGVRALQLAFRKHLDTTPSGYVRRVRLDRAHADLLAADPAEQTVARIAAGWGFADPSRFTALYKQTYGQLPSSTLNT